MRFTAPPEKEARQARFAPLIDCNKRLTANDILFLSNRKLVCCALTAVYNAHPNFELTPPLKTAFDASRKLDADLVLKMSENMKGAAYFPAFVYLLAHNIWTPPTCVYSDLSGKQRAAIYNLCAALVKGHAYAYFRHPNKHLRALAEHANGEETALEECFACMRPDQFAPDDCNGDVVRSIVFAMRKERTFTTDEIKEHFDIFPFVHDRSDRNKQFSCPPQI